MVASHDPRPDPPISGRGGGYVKFVPKYQKARGFGARDRMSPENSGAKQKRRRIWSEAFFDLCPLSFVLCPLTAEACLLALAALMTAEEGMSPGSPARGALAARHGRHARSHSHHGHRAAP